MGQEILWLSKHQKEAEKFSGRWIAILKDRIIASGDSVKAVMQEVEKKGIKELPLVMKVPRKDEEAYIL